MTTQYKNASAHRDAIMNEMAKSPMATVVERMAREILVKGKPMGAAKAKAYYVDAVKTGRCPGKIESTAPVVKTAKAPKAPVVPKASKAAKAPTDRKEVLKAAAKRAGVHRDSIAEALGDDADPLNLGAPEKLSLDDLKFEI